MDARDNIQQVVAFFDTHPINEEQILRDIERDGIALEALTEEALQKYDQDHFGGLQANEALADEAGISRDSRVLDVCCGIGGPARYLASTRGCKVTGIDITKSRVDSAIRLTRLCKLEDRVDFVHGNAMDMPFDDATFDVVVSQEAFAHIPDQSRLIGECVRVLEPGGTIAFTAIVSSESLAATALARVRDEMAAAVIETSAGYLDLLTKAGCVDVSCEDLGVWWTEILVERLAMYRSLQSTTVAKFGEAHYERWDDTYAFFVDLFRNGQLGGGRFVARRDRR